MFVVFHNICVYCVLRLLVLCGLRTLRVRTRAFDPRVAEGMHVYSVAEGMQVYSVAIGVQMYSVTGGIQVYSVTNYSTCCFLLHLQLPKNYI